MHKKSTFRCLAIAAFVSSLGMTTIPSAGALEPPSASDVVSQTAQELANAGIPVDPAVTNGAVAAAQNAEQAAQNAQQAVDSAVNSLSAATPVAPTVPEAPAVPNFTQDIPPEQAMPEVVPRISSELSSAINSVTGSSQQPAPSPSVPETAVTPETPNAPTVPNVPSVPANALESVANIVNTEKSENKTQDTEAGADSDEYEPGRTETPPLVRRYIDAQIKEATAPSERAISSVSQLFENINKLRDGSLSSTEYSANKLMQRPNINRNAAEFEAQVAQFESQVAQLASSGVNYAGEPYKEVGKDYRPIIDGPNYHWQYDPFSKFMAQRFTANRVLHRVPGSWFDQPDTPLASVFTEREGNSLYGPSTPVYVGDNQLCTVAATGYDKQGRKVAITAGHCGNPGDPVKSADSWRVGRSGTVVDSNKELDYSVIELDSNARVSRHYNNVTVNHVGGETPGQWKRVCKTGVASGTTCGHVWVADEGRNVSQVCAMAGDSGAPVMEGDRLVGMVSGGVLPDHNLSCRTPWQGSAHMPTISTNFEAVRHDIDAKDGVGAGFRLPDD